MKHIDTIDSNNKEFRRIQHFFGELVTAENIKLQQQLHQTFTDKALLVFAKANEERERLTDELLRPDLLVQPHHLLKVFLDGSDPDAKNYFTTIRFDMQKARSQIPSQPRDSEGKYHKGKLDFSSPLHDFVNAVQKGKLAGMKISSLELVQFFVEYAIVEEAVGIGFSIIRINVGKEDQGRIPISQAFRRARTTRV